MGIPVFMYHEVNEKKRINDLSRFINRKYIVEIGNFEAQLEFLRSVNCQAGNIAMFSTQEVRSPSRKRTAITFDDGYAGNFEFVFPLLTRLGFTATFFITTAWVGLPNMLSWQQIREMSEGGMEIGSHTCSHLLLAAADKEKIEDELRASKAILEEKIKKPVVSISYPNGSFNTLVNTIAYESGYTHACVSQLGYWKEENSAFVIPRVTATDNLARFKKIMEQDRCFYFKEKTVERAKKMTRTIFGEKIYNKLYFKLFDLKEIKK